MNKLKQNALYILLFIFGLFIWIYKMIITGDKILNISFKEWVMLILMITIYVIFQCLYIKKNIFNIINLIFNCMLLVPWSVDLILSLKYNYSIYYTYINIMGFSSIVIPIILTFIYKAKINPKNN